MADERRARIGYALTDFGNASTRIQAVRRKELHRGDCILVRTRNSVYVLRSMGDGCFTARGGWFSRKGKDGVRTSVSGCSLGGSIIKIDIIAACGLCIEFSNRLVTSPVQWFTVFPGGWEN